MRYWLIALPRPDMERCIEVGVFGLSRKHVLGSVRSGDKIGCYVTKEFKIIAFGEVTSEHYLDDSPIFLRDGIYADRIDFDAKPLGSGKEVDFISVIDDMKFIKDVSYWSVYFSKGIVEITQHDWEKLLSKVRNLTKAKKDLSSEMEDTF